MEAWECCNHVDVRVRAWSYYAHGGSPSDITVTVVGCVRFKVERRTRMYVMDVRVTKRDNKHDKGVSTSYEHSELRVSGIITTVPCVDMV